MNVEIGTEAGQFPEKEYIIGILLAVQSIHKRVLINKGGSWNAYATKNEFYFEELFLQKKTKIILEHDQKYNIVD